MKYIVRVDIGSKQKYIFSSNRLKEIIGASEIIRYVTEKLGVKVLEMMNKDPKYYGDDNDGNILFIAGGNAMYIFGNKNEAVKFNKIFSRFVVKYFDGLELLVVINEFDIYNKKMVSLHEEIEEILTSKKGKRKNQFRRIGYGLTRICSSTRRPAVFKLEDEDKYISKESRDKLKFYDFMYKDTGIFNDKNIIKYSLGINENGNEIMIEKNKLKNTNKELKNGFRFTNKLDDIAGEKNKGSYIGITCIDGNGMGRKFNSFNEKYIEDNTRSIFELNKEYIREFRKLMENVNEDYEKAFSETIDELIDNYDNYHEKIGYKKDDRVVPVRSIILAGDDVSFVSNGKLSIEITKMFTEKITNQRELFGKNMYNLTTSAGIAIVKKKHPFSRAVKLANALEKNSKKRLREVNILSKGKLKDASFIDWEINRGDTSDDISIIRDKNVVARPYIIVTKKDKEFNERLSLDNSNDCKILKGIINYNFDNFHKVFNAVISSEAKSNLKSFFRTMNSQEIDSELFYLKYNLKNKIKDINPNMLKNIVYDAIDLMDLYIYVKGEK